MANEKYSVNILGNDAKLFAKVSAKIERRSGLKPKTIQVVRLALGALAKQEGIK